MNVVEDKVGIIYTLVLKFITCTQYSIHKEDIILSVLLKLNLLITLGKALRMEYTPKA